MLGEEIRSGGNPRDGYIRGLFPFPPQRFAFTGLLASRYIWPMLKFLPLAFSVFSLLVGAYSIVAHGNWMATMEESYTEQSGRIAGDPAFHQKVDTNPFNPEYASVTFRLEGEGEEYSIVIPPGSRLVREKLLRTGDEVQLAYVDPGITPPKRRVWQLARNGEPPLLTASAARAHVAEKNTSMSFSFVFLGLAGLIASSYWIIRG